MMKNCSPLITCLALVLTSGTASAALLVEETFNYTPVPANTGTSAVAGSAANLLVNQGGYSTNLGNYTIYDGADTISDVSPFGTDVNTLRVGSGNNATKGITTTKGTTYYFSYLFEVASGVDAQVRFGGTSDQNFEIGTNTSLEFGVGSNVTSGSTTQTTLTAGDTYFVLGSFTVANDDQWTVNANLYTSAASVPTSVPTWTHTYTQNFGDKGVVDEYIFQSSGGNAYFNGLRVGDTFAEVAIPEPSTFALVGLTTVAAIIGLRRRT